MKERDCANCKHHTLDGCSSWDCEFEAKDYISRADAIEAVCKGCHWWSGQCDNDKAFRCDEVCRIEALPSADAVQGAGRYENAMQKLREMPSYLNGVKAKQIKKISAEAVHGEWHQISPARIYECSICNHNVLTDYIDTYNYCPSCGARMKGGDDE